MVAFKSGSIIAFPMRENVHWTHLLGLRFRPFCPDLRALLIMERLWASLQGWPITTSSAYLRKETNDSEKRSESWRVKGSMKGCNEALDYFALFFITQRQSHSVPVMLQENKASVAIRIRDVNFTQYRTQGLHWVGLLIWLTSEWYFELGLHVRSCEQRPLCIDL